MDFSPFNLSFFLTLFLQLKINFKIHYPNYVTMNVKELLDEHENLGKQ